MGGNKPATQWHAAAVDNTPLMQAAEGDGLNAVRELRDTYLAKARYIELLGHDPSFYLRAAGNVARLLGDVAANTLTVELTLAVA